MDESRYWKQFESTGQISAYLHYKQDAGAPAQKESNNADHDHGAGAPGHQNR